MKNILQLTREQAITIYQSKVWEKWTDEEKAKFQFYQDLLCMPFDIFHEAFEKTIGRSVWTHEFMSSNEENLRAEFEGKIPAPSFEEIIALIPKEKLILLELPEERRK